MQSDKREAKNSKASGLLIFFLLVAAILFIAYKAYLKIGSESFNNIDIQKLISKAISEVDSEAAEETKIIEIKYEVREKPAFEIYNNWIIKSTIYSIKALNKNGREQWNIPVLLEKPLLKSCKSGLLVADIGGRNIYFIKDKSIKWQTAADGDIINADISKEGFVSVVHKTEGYKAVIVIFDQDGQEVFRRYIVDTFVISTKIPPSGKQVMINSLDVSGANASSYIEFTDLLGNPFAALVPKEGEVYPVLLPLNDGSFGLINDTEIIYYNSDREKTWEYEYEKIYASEVISSEYFILAVKKKDSRSGLTDILIINKKGQEVGKQTIEGQVLNIFTGPEYDIAAISNKREVNFVNSKGKFEGRFSSISDVEKVLFSGKNEAALITKDCITIVKIKQ